MKIIAVDDERDALAMICQAIVQAAPDAQIKSFSSAMDALEYARQNQIDVAFLDIQLTEKNGVLLAKQLREIYRGTNIIFVTGHSEYAPSAFSIFASGYVMKPINPERVRKELENLRNPIQNSDKGIRIQCFGNFEVFVDGVPVVFPRAKSKEALAYLVDRRGAAVTKKELATVLRENAEYSRSIQSYTHKILADMMSALKAAKAAPLVYKKRNLYAINMNLCTCDYYQYLQGDVAAINAYRGEYMAKYSWAEFTAGELST